MKKNNVILLLLLISLSLIALVRPNQVQAKPITVTGENFDEYFNSTGSATTVHDTVNNTVTATLTPNEINKTGSFYLNQKISVEDDFTLKGEVYLGNKSDADNPGGADGIGFAFYPGEIGQLGFAGAGVGIAGIKNAVGFKLDTCWNWANKPDPNSSSEIVRLGNDDDWPAYGKRGGDPFGGFLTTNGTNGYITNDYDSNKHLQLENYSVVKHDSKPIPIEFDYNGDGGEDGKGTITVILGDPNGTETVFDETGQTVIKMGTKLTWTREVESTEPLAMHMAGSTGAKYNEQYFIFKEFTFEPDKTVTVNDIWEDNNNQENERPTTGGFTIMHKTSETDYTEYQHYDTSFEDLDGNTLTTTIEKLPKRDASDHEYSYTVVPDKIENTDYVSECVVNEDGDEWTVTHTFVGHIALNSVPDLLSWTERPLPQSGELLNRDNVMTVTVEDNRPNKAGWNVSAQVVPTENNEYFSLFSLVWKNPGSTETQALNGLPVLSKESATNEGSMYSSTWSEDSGVLLKTDGDLAIDDYSGKLQIRWTLNLTPDG